MSILSDKAVEIAISQIGKEENPRGSNWGKTGDPVPQYLASVGIDFPAAWCMALMYWCFKGAAEALGVPNPLLKTGKVLAEWAGRPRNQVKVPAVGDLFVMDFGHELGHIGIIEKIDPDGALHTIEGNTNTDGSREGYEVERKTRKQGGPIIGYLRF